MAKNYWRDRMAASQQRISNKSVRAIEMQLRRYYKSAMDSTIDSFTSTYDKLLATVAADKAPTPADLYNLKKYWEMQGQLSLELEKLGNKQATMMSSVFEMNFFEVYHSINVESAKSFATIDKSMVQQLINHIWCADGKSWSQRIWLNTSKLAETLNEQLIACVVTGKKTSDLKAALQERFGVSYAQADSLARTEIAHIQTQAAQKRYEDSGVNMVEVWADEDERRCPVCAKLHQTKYPIGAQMPIPAHPRCRCCIIPVIE